MTAVVLLKHGRVFATGDKRELLLSDTVSSLFDTPLEVVEHGGYYQVYQRS